MQTYVYTVARLRNRTGLSFIRQSLSAQHGTCKHRERRESRHSTCAAVSVKTRVCDALCFHVRRSVTYVFFCAYLTVFFPVYSSVFAGTTVVETYGVEMALQRRRFPNLCWQVFSYLTLEFLWIVFPTITALSELKTPDSVMSVPIRPVYRRAFQDPWQRSQAVPRARSVPQGLSTSSTTRRRSGI